MKKLIIRILSAALCCFMICASLASCASINSSSKEKETVLKVGEYEVPYELYRYLVLNYKLQVQDKEEDWNDSKKAEEMTKEINVLVESSLRDFYAVFSLATEFGVDRENPAVNAAVEAELEATRNGYKNQKEYVDALAEGFMTHSAYELLQTNAICSDELYYKMMNDGAIKADEEFLKEFIYGDGFIRIKQILIVGESSNRVHDGTVYIPEESHTDEEAKAIAELARSKALAGEDFDNLVAEYGESFQMFGNKDGYYICEGYWDDVNNDAVFALEIGGISEVVESSQGYSVYMRCEKEDSYIDSHFDELRDKYTEAQYSLAVEKRAAEFEITTTELYDSISIKDMSWEADRK
ncbi:MAG: peptidyl-prolyl cis-trans isomerase [Clostridia bacterium]|nr:peptidyl-prolyl cis-trans isomerase [Clostridia bacterium]